MGLKQSIELPGMNVDATSIVVAGYSCGSQMAENMLIIESDTIKGAALFNGFSTYGGWADETTTDAQITERVNLISTNYAAGKVDNPVNLQTPPVYIFRGDGDSSFQQIG